VDEVKRLLALLALAAAAAVVITSLPDIKRYIEISRM
jgi:hypothetical protein